MGEDRRSLAAPVPPRRARWIFFSAVQLCAFVIVLWTLRWPIYDTWMRWQLGDKWIPSYDSANNPGCLTFAAAILAAVLVIISAAALMTRSGWRHNVAVFITIAIEALFVLFFAVFWYGEMFRAARAQVTRLALRSVSAQLRAGMTEDEVHRAIQAVNLALIRTPRAGVPLSAIEKDVRDRVMARANGSPVAEEEYTRSLESVFTRGWLDEGERIERYGRTPFRGSMEEWHHEMIEVVYGTDGKLLNASYRKLDHHWNGEELFQCQILWEIPREGSRYPYVVSPTRDAICEPDSPIYLRNNRLLGRIVVLNVRSPRPNPASRPISIADRKWIPAYSRLTAASDAAAEKLE
jgi:hypothetical protein